jgi:hypothetical protein
MANNRPAYTLLSGAKKNLGDFLIFGKAKELIALHTGEDKFLELNRWERLDPHMDDINSTRAVVLCGGPAYGHDFYPGIIPLTENIGDIKVPVIPMGIGWSGEHEDPAKFTFSKDSLKALRYIHERCQYSGVRDYITKDIMNRQGYENVLMTGCPVMFDVPSIGKPFSKPDIIKKLVFTVPSNIDLLLQSIHIMSRLKSVFKDAELIASFHRGIKADQHTSLKESLGLRFTARAAATLGYRVVDVSYDVRNIEFYRDCDLHVGYRVHAHVFFCSICKPTFLIQEDGRGVGMSEALGLPDIHAYRKDAVKKLTEGVREQFESGFPQFDKTHEIIEIHYNAMTRLIKSMIGTKSLGQSDEDTKKAT